MQRHITKTVIIILGFVGIVWLMGSFLLSNHQTSENRELKIEVDGQKVVVPATKVTMPGTVKKVDAPKITISKREIESARNHMAEAGLGKISKKLSLNEIARLIQKANVTSLDVTTQYKYDHNLLDD